LDSGQFGQMRSNFFKKKLFENLSSRVIQEVFLDTKANFGLEFTLNIVDIHCRGISLLVIRHMNLVSFGICWPI
jgi:hypothetical protein